MTIHTTYANARANLASLLIKAAKDKEIILINLRKTEDVALISYSELSSLMGTTHILRSPQNAQRLLTALNRALADTEPVSSLEKLRKKFDFE